MCSTVRQAAAGVVDELRLDVAPVLLGSGERLIDGTESFGFEPVELLHSPLATIAAGGRDERGPGRPSKMTLCVTLRDLVDL